MDTFNLDYEIGVPVITPPPDDWLWNRDTPQINMARAEESDELEVVFPHLDFTVYGDIKLARHKSESGTRMTNVSPELREFIVRFLCTLNAAVATDPDAWFLLYDVEKQCAHLPLACGWAFSKYCKASVKKVITFSKVSKSSKFPPVGNKGCGCASIMAANPRLLIHDTPMVALSRFSGSMVVGCLKEVKGAARQKQYCGKRHDTG